jgi:hypothetical protein
MIRTAEVEWFRQNVNSLIALVFVGFFALGAGMLIWHSAFGKDPVIDGLASVIAPQMQE